MITVSFWIILIKLNHACKIMISQDMLTHKSNTVKRQFSGFFFI